ncbi:hypothetical protein [Desulfonatronum sp. SC1]|uniref:hypothetical protein n=1 Tax=Desulfonatronum sp. SC1 TaxID=2109626 RepID=UPI0011B2975A|nr:hypothetical protein [Desulfonatronum sp. SC1]
MKEKIIFIAGANHSGSTLLGCILGAHYKSPFKYFHVGEIHAFFDMNKKNYGNPMLTRNSLYGKVWNEINHEVGYKDAYKEIFEKAQADIIIDSSKSYRNFTIANQSCLNNNYQLHVLISFRPFAKIFQSDLKRNKSEKDIITNLSRYFLIKNKIIDNHYPYTIINSEDLILAPRNMTIILCEELGIPYFEGKENYWNYNSCHLYGSKTQRLHLKDSNKAGYDKEKVLAKPNISHPFLERKDVHDLEFFFREKSLKY